MAQTSSASAGSKFEGLCLPGVQLADEKSRRGPRQASFMECHTESCVPGSPKGQPTRGKLYII